MMDAFSALLEARDPALGRFRAYRLEAGTDLLGDWLVDYHLRAHWDAGAADPHQWFPGRLEPSA